MYIKYIVVAAILILLILDIIKRSSAEFYEETMDIDQMEICHEKCHHRCSRCEHYECKYNPKTDK